MRTAMFYDLPPWKNGDIARVYVLSSGGIELRIRHTSGRTSHTFMGKEQMSRLARFLNYIIINEYVKDIDK